MSGNRVCACPSGLPRAIRDALVSWNHSTVYELPSHHSYSAGPGKGLFEKTYDLGAHHSQLSQRRAAHDPCNALQDQVALRSLCIVNRPACQCAAGSPEHKQDVSSCCISL